MEYQHLPLMPKGWLIFNDFPLGIKGKKSLKIILDHLYYRQQSNCDKSNMELKTRGPENYLAFRVEDNNPSGSNITLKLKTQKVIKSK